MSLADDADHLKTLPRALTHRISFLLAKVADYSRGEFEQALAPLGLKPRHYGVLTVLATERPSTQQSLGARLRLDRTTMVAVVDELERLGLVERRRNPKDRRAYDLTITNAGRELLPRLEALGEAAEDTVLAPLDAEQRQHLHDLLTHLLQPKQE